VGLVLLELVSGKRKNKNRQAHRAQRLLKVIEDEPRWW